MFKLMHYTIYNRPPKKQQQQQTNKQKTDFFLDTV